MIILDKVSEKQLLEMEIGLLHYNYILTKFSQRVVDEDFKDVFTNFYLSS